MKKLEKKVVHHRLRRGHCEQRHLHRAGVEERYKFAERLLVVIAGKRPLGLRAPHLANDPRSRLEIGAKQRLVLTTEEPMDGHTRCQARRVGELRGIADLPVPEDHNHKSPVERQSSERVDARGAANVVLDLRLPELLLSGAQLLEGLLLGQRCHDDYLAPWPQVLVQGEQHRAHARQPPDDDHKVPSSEWLQKFRHRGPGDLV
mmetsp:Transcript_106136/g.307106  ORF Transcript_106136/g.307106 Transcript_106136/m.307106 type:complete len:204 (-) Transcript_106136:1363-1974(-)